MTVLLVVFVVVGLILVGVPIWVGVATLKGSPWAAVWGSFFVFACLLAVIQNPDWWGYVSLAIVVAAAVILWLPTNRGYALHRRS